MAQVRYLGFVVGDGTLDATREAPTLGRFVSLPEPLPVGTIVELDGASHQITRVEEGAASGFWFLPAGAARTSARPAVPQTIDPDTTAKSEPPVIELVADAEEEPEPPPAAGAPGREDGAPDPATDDSSRGGKRKRRPKKTVLGR